MKDTTDPAYARPLQNLSDTWWKRLLDVQRPYRWNLKRLNFGKNIGRRVRGRPEPKEPEPSVSGHRS